MVFGTPRRENRHFLLSNDSIGDVCVKYLFVGIRLRKQPKKGVRQLKSGNRYHFSNRLREAA